jgi:hypothetical protein
MRYTWRSWVGLTGALGLIGLATLVPYPEQAELSRSTPLGCLVCGELGGVDVLLNLALFVPLGIALRAAGIPLSKCVVVAFTTSLAVEVAQATAVTGRDPSLSDLLTNTAGGWLGALLGARLAMLWRPGAPLAGRLALGAGLGWLGMLAVTAWAVRPIDPAGGLRIHRAPRLPMVDTFAGRIEAVRVEGTIPTRDLAIHATARLDGWTEHLAPAVDLGDAGSRVAARIGQLGQKVTFGVRSNASRLRLRPPLVKVYRALPPARGQQVELSGGLSGNRLWARAAAEGSVAAAELPLTPGLGWLLLLPLTFYPFDYRPELTTAGWVALPLLLAGFWAGRQAAWRRPSRAAQGATSVAAAALLLVLGLGVVPEVFGVAADGWPSWAAGAGALATGWGAGRYAPGAASTSVPPSARSA